MRVKTMVAVCIAVLVGAAAWAGGTSEESGGTGVSDAGGPLTPYDPQITVSIWRVDNPSVEWVNGNTPDDNIWYDFYRDELGINLENIWTVAATEADQKISVSIASGDLPDIITASFSQVKQLADNELLADLQPHWDAMASDVVRDLIEAPNLPPAVDYSEIEEPLDWATYGWQGAPEALDAVTIDGKLAALPQSAIIDQSWQLWYVRRDWLENVGMDVPTTFEELLAVARAFAAQDPDGNGEDDTIGLGLEKNFLLTQVFHMIGISSAFHAYPSMWIEDEYGDLAYGSVQPEMREALATLRSLYAEGVLDREFPVKDWPKVGESLAAGKIGLFGASMWNPLNPIQANVSNEPDADWTSFRLVSADSSPARPITRSFNAGSYYAASAEADHPEALVKMMNLMAQWRDEVVYGEDPSEGALALDRVILPDGRSQEVWLSWNPISGPRRENNVPIHLSVTAAIEQNDTSMLFSLAEQRYEQSIAYLEGDTNQYGWYGVFGPEGAQDRIVQYRDMDLGLLNAYYGPPTETELRRGSTLETLELQTFTAIIIGQEPLEAFDTFVEDWKRLGGDDWTAEVNEWAAAR